MKKKRLLALALSLSLLAACGSKQADPTPAPTAQPTPAATPPPVGERGGRGRQSLYLQRSGGAHRGSGRPVPRRGAF